MNNFSDVDQAKSEIKRSDQEVRDAMDQLKEKIEQASHQAQDFLQQADTFMDKVRHPAEYLRNQNPLSIIAYSLIGGFALAKMIRRRRGEEEREATIQELPRITKAGP